MKKYNILKKIACLAAVSLMFLSCSVSNSSSDAGANGNYAVQVNNLTGGILVDVTVDTNPVTYCGTLNNADGKYYLQPGEDSVVYFEFRPVNVTVRYNSSKVMGQGIELNGKNTFETAFRAKLETCDIILDDKYFSLNVFNAGTGTVDLLGFNFSNAGSAGVDSLNEFGMKTGYSNFSEKLAHTGNTVSDTIGNTGASSVKFFLSASENLSFEEVAITGEVLYRDNGSAEVTGGSEQTLEYYYVKPSTAEDHFLNVFADIGGVQTDICQDMGNGVLQGSGIEGDGTVDYKTGAISFTLTAAVAEDPTLGDITCNYTYIDTGVGYTTSASLTSVPVKQGFLVVKAGDTVLGTDAEESGRIKGDGIYSFGTIDYNNGNIMFSVEESVMNAIFPETTQVTCEYVRYLGEGGGSGETGTATGAGIDVGGTINFDTGEIIFDLLEGVAPEGEFTVFCDYHAPIVLPVGDVAEEAAVITGVQISNEGSGDTVTAVLKGVVEAGTVKIYAVDPAVPDSDPVVTGEDDSSGAITGTNIVSGSIDYTTGEVKIEVAAGFGSKGVTVDYSYKTPLKNIWMGFYSRTASDSISSIYPLQMTDKDTIAGHFDSYADITDFLKQNESGSWYLDLICGNMN